MEEYNVSMKYLDCYIRVSTKEQKDKGHSIENQKHSGKKVSKLLGLKYREHDEGNRSSTIHDRTILREIEDEIVSGKIKTIWIMERERLFRNKLQSGLFRRDYLNPYDVKLLVGIHGTELKFDTPQDRLTNGILEEMSQYENEVRSERSKSGKKFLLDKYSDTIPIFLGGTPLFGYDNKDRKWIINKEESKWIKWIFKEYSLGKSTREIKIHLDKSGVTPRRSKTWNIGTLQMMLKNESYLGIKSWKHERDTKNEKEYVIKIPSIIDVTTFNKCQKMLKKNIRVNTNKKSSFHLLENLLLCECGNKLGGTIKRYVRENKITIGKSYYCVGKERQWKGYSVNKCKNLKSLNMDETDNLITEIVKRIYEDSSILKESIRKEVLSKKKRTPEDFKEEKKTLTNKMKVIQQEMEDISTSIGLVRVDIIRKRIDKKSGTVTMNQLESELDNLKIEYDNVMNDINNVDVNKDWLNWMKKFSENLKSNLSKQESTQTFLEGLIDKIVVSGVNGLNRDKKKVQIGHDLDIHFKMNIVGDELVYLDDKKKSLGYNLIEGKNRQKTQIVGKSSSMITSKSGKKK